MTPATTSRITPAQRLRVITGTALIPGVVALLAIALVLAILPRLPETVATHWGANGQADGYSPSWFGVLIIAGIAALFIAIATGTALSKAQGGEGSGQIRLLTGILGGATGLISALVALSLLGQVDIVDATAAELPIGPSLGWAALIAVPVGLLSALAIPALDAVAQDTDATVEPLGLAPGERAVWSRSVSAPVALWILLGAVLIAVGGTTVTTGFLAGVWWPLATAVIVILLAATTLRFRVSVTPEGLKARSVLGWPAFRVPTAAVDTVSATSVSPNGEFGGWGIRSGSGGRWGVILKSGPAIEVARRDGKRTFVVTVPDAETGAALLADYAETASEAR